jgi:acyl-coenzyme A synthetase/AMP-(fatty) acid ligase
VKVASEVAYEFDIRQGDVFFWLTDMGWVMGPLSTFGTHALGATLLLYEGAPDTPDPGRLWSLAERHEVTMLGVSPTLIRALKPHGDALPASYDLSAVRVFGSTGEPWDEDSYMWLSRVVGQSRVPIINFSGGTEVGGAFLAPFVVEPIKPCSLGGPSLGMDVDVFDAAGHPVRDQLGELVCRQPWPAMTRGVWGDSERYHDSYWSTFPGVWRHGDWAKVDGEGQWFLYGRSDEAINVAGKRVGPAEVEGVLVAHDAVAEAATPPRARRSGASGRRLGAIKPTSRTSSRRRSAASSASRSPRAASCASAHCPRRARRRSCGARSELPRSAPTPATCPAPITPRRSISFEPPSESMEEGARHEHERRRTRAGGGGLGTRQ